MVRKRRDFGNVNPLPSGQFQARYKMDGKWRNASNTFRSELEADQWLKEQKEMLHVSSTAGESLDGNATFNEWADLFETMPLRRMKKTVQGVTAEKRVRTVKTYKSVLGLHVRPFLGHMRVSDITVATIRTFQRTCSDRLVGQDSTNKKAQDYARWVLNLAVKLDAIPRNPYAHPTITMPNGGGKRMGISIDQKALYRLASFHSDHYQIVPVFTAFTGLRSGEVWALKRRSVNVEEGELQVVASVGEVAGHGLVMGPPKNGRSRVISLPEPILEDLVQYMDAHPGDPDDWLFRTVRGKQVRHSNFTEDVFRPSCVDAGLSGLRFHDLRHFCAHYHIALGWEPYQIMDLLGHSSISVTMDVYGGLFKSDRRAAAKLVGEQIAEFRRTSVEQHPLLAVLNEQIESTPTL